jgi:hypothetical protein
MIISGRNGMNSRYAWNLVVDWRSLIVAITIANIAMILFVPQGQELPALRQ